MTPYQWLAVVVLGGVALVLAGLGLLVLRLRHEHRPPSPVHRHVTVTGSYRRPEAVYDWAERT